MALTDARELIQVQLQFGSGYNRNSVRWMLAEVQRVHGQSAVDRLIGELDLERVFGLAPGKGFSSLGY